MASHTIASTNSGVTLLPAGYYNPVTVEAGIIVSSPSIAIDAPTEWTVYNLGTVTDTGTAGILLEQGGTVINGQSGSTVAAAYIGGAGEAIDITGAAGSVANYGTIHGAGDGVFLEQGGAVTNGASGATSAGITGSSGVNVANVSGTVTNDGTISGTSGDGVFLALGGNVINGAANPTASAALITGSSYGMMSGVTAAPSPTTVRAKPQRIRRPTIWWCLDQRDRRHQRGADQRRRWRPRVPEHR